MRKYFFRGKRKDNGEWVIGKGIDTNFGEAYILYGWKDASVGLFNVDDIEVIPETIGQYTGVTDKNGKKIFEGDIVRYNGEKHIVVFETRGETGYFGIKIDHIETWGFCLSVPAKLMEVIGNIHDNPELTEGLL